MDASPITLISSPLASNGAAAFSPAAGEEGVRGSDFASLFGQFMASADGRHGLPAAGASGLQSLSLSPNIEVITADEPLPDNDSLLAFAQSQGLDNAMIHALFLPGQGGAQLTGAKLGADGLLPAAGSGASLAGLAALGGQALRKLEVQMGAAQAQAQGPTQAAAQAADAQQAQAGAQLLQDAMRLRLQPQEAVTRRLAALAASGEQARWGQVMGQPVGEAATLSLDLAGMSAESVDALVLAADAPAPSHLAGHLPEPSRSLSFGQASPDTPVASTAGERAAQYEQLAQRLGQALGQRLQAQIERGEWKVQMQVDPASLGRIDMELDMRAGGLDAVFRSDNQVTRDLIAQGLPRLRETLAQSGTAVANVWVQGDSSRQSGGNPTPGRWASAPNASAKSQEEEVAPAAVAPPRAGSSAWDVLA